MTVREALAQGKQILTQSLNESNLTLDCSLLLAHNMGISREQLYARLSDPLEEGVFSSYQGDILRRSQGFPLAYITGIKEFYGLDFCVEPGVLCPRPDTETLVEGALKYLEHWNGKEETPAILDLCTGTGCIALSIESSSGFSVDAADVSPQSEKCFQKNKKLLGLNSTFIPSDLFQGIQRRYNLIVTNPPYLTSKETQERMEQRWKEPTLALDGGNDGLDLIRVIAREAPKYLLSQGRMMIEAHPDQMEAIGNLLKENGFSKVSTLLDLTERERVIQGVCHG